MSTVTPVKSLHTFNPASDREPIVRALKGWIAKRANIQRSNYESKAAYWKDGRVVLRDRRDAEALLDYLSHTTITAADLIESARTTWGGRLTFHHEGGDFKVQYQCGQYPATEYRAVVCAIVANAIKRYEQALASDHESHYRKFLGRHLIKRWLTK